MENKRSANVDDEQAKIEREERVQIFASRIGRLANEAVAKRSVLETRWLADLRQHEGQYAPTTESALKADPTKSMVFANMTRRSVNAAEARLVDMLFPTDDKNWGIKPTPVPELSVQRKQAKQMGDEQTTVQIDVILEQAEKAAKGMEREIDDQLSESDYNGKARDAVHDCCLYGTGVLKAPVIVGQVKKMWREQQDETGQAVHILEIIEKHAPTVQHVSIWNYFPDPNAVTQTDCEYELERHYMTRRQLVGLSKSKGFFHKEIVALLKEGTTRNTSDNGRMAQMRAISGLQTMNYLENRYEVWEYHGAVERDELIDLGVEVDDEQVAEFDCVVFVCNNRVIKAAINPMDTEDHPYCVVPYQRDEASIFGKGIPYLMRDSQGILSAAWRTMIENMGLSSGDQIVVDRKAIKPADGSWRLSARKVWYKNDQNVPINAAFATFPIASHQAELMNIIDAAMKMADEETNMPRLMYGESAGASAETMGGMAMQMNAANVVLRRAIKNFDDHITRPLIRQMYDFNMQFNNKPEIKGDFSVNARGSSALLVKEQQAQSLMQLLQIIQNPAFLELTDVHSLFKKVVQAMHLESDGVLISDDELEQLKQEAQQNPQQQPQDPVLAKAQMDMQITQMKMQAEQQLEQARMQERQQDNQAKQHLAQQEMQVKLELAQSEREIAMMKLSSERDMSLEQINARLKEAQLNSDTKRQLMLMETQVKATMGSGL